MPLIRRMPKRGFRNGAFQRPYQLVNTGSLNRYQDGDKVDYDTLLKDGLVSRKNAYVKLLGKGDLTKKLHVVVDRASKSAREAVEMLGGTLEIGEGASAAGARGADTGGENARGTDTGGENAPRSSEKGYIDG
jgi:ribosomal protein L15